MATKQKTKPAGVTKADNYVVVDLHLLKSNSCQPRKNGVIPNLNEEGYGLFSQTEELVNKKKLKNEDGTDKMCLWDMLMSDKPELWPIAVGLIDENEPEIVELATSLAGSTQLHNIGITPIDDKDHSKGFDVVYGMCRSIARAYNYARSVGELPCNVKAEIAQDFTDPMDLTFRAMQENRGRRSESLIDEALQIQYLKRNGVTIPQIADRLGTNQQNVRNRLKLLRLTKEEQLRVHTGKLGMVNANKLVDKRDKGQAGEGETAADKPENRKRMPTLKQAQTNYAALEKPSDDMTDIEWGYWTNNEVRKFIAFYIGVEYKSHRDMVAEAKKLEKERLNAEALRQAAEAAEAQPEEAVA